MKNYLLLLLIAVSFLAKAQKADSTSKGFGIGLNTEYNSLFNGIEVAPTAIYYKGKNQFELGAGFNPFSLKHERIVSAQLNYKHFPNGRANKFDMYFMLSCNYTNQLKKTFYPTTNQYLSLSGGYGFQVTVANRLNLGTNLNLGTFTQGVQSKNPYIEQLGAKKMFDNLGMNLSFQVNLGYRF